MLDDDLAEEALGADEDLERVAARLSSSVREEMRQAHTSPGTDAATSGKRAVQLASDPVEQRWSSPPGSPGGPRRDT